MMKRLLFTLLIAVSAVPAAGQSLTVQVFAGQEEAGRMPLADAWVYLSGPGRGGRTDAAGKATFEQIDPPTQLSVQHPGWTGTLRTVDAGTSHIEVTLTPGNINGDGAVDLVDVAALVDFLGERPGADPPAWHPAYDFDDSGTLAKGDLAFITAHFDTTGTVPSYRLIDDGEDGDADTQLPLGSYWQTFSDQINGGNTQITPGSGNRVSMTPGGVHSSDYAAKFSYVIGDGAQYPFAQMRVLTTSSDAGSINAQAFSGLEFWLKGNGKPIAISLKAGPTDDDYSEYRHVIESTPSEWTRYALSFEEDFQQPSFGIPETIESVLGDLEAIQFATDVPEAGDHGAVWVDNLQFRYEGVPVSGGTVAGQVVDQEEAPVGFAAVSISASGKKLTALTDESGNFSIADVPVGTQTVTATRTGYANAETEVTVMAGASTTSTIRLNRTVPVEKPTSTGPVRIAGRDMETDFDGDGTYGPYQVKGAALSITPIGRSSGASVDARYYERAMAFLDTLNATTIRTYDRPGSDLLNSAADYGIHVIASYFVSSEEDLSDPDTRQQLVQEFRSMVADLKDEPAVLMWNIGNEQNIPGSNGDSPYWYDLVQEMAIAAYQEEGASFHPVAANNYTFDNIGNASLQADDASLTYMDLWASNYYTSQLGSVLSSYASKSDKPVVITEFGIDAWDHRNDERYEQVQADFVAQNWKQIAGSDVAVGGTVFEFIDEWWKADGQPGSHDYGGYQTGAHPDGFANEEWWGLIEQSRDSNGDGLDEWRARPVYFRLQELWQE